MHKLLDNSCSLCKKRTVSSSGLWIRGIEKHPTSFAFSWFTVHKSNSDSFVNNHDDSACNCLAVPVQVSGFLRRKSKQFFQFRFFSLKIKLLIIRFTMNITNQIFAEILRYIPIFCDYS